MLRAINNIHVVAPADNFETRETIRQAITYPFPLYIRFGKKPVLNLHDPATEFAIGKAITITEGTDVAFIGTGEPVAQALLAAQQLEQRGISCRVISMHTVKPLDEVALLEAARDTQVLITVEEHSIYGGLGEACAATLLRHQVYVPFEIVGIPDEDTVTGSQSEIFDYYGISADGLAATAQRLLEMR